MRKVAGIAFFLFAGLSLALVLAYLVLLTEFDLPIGPPLVLLGLVALSFTAVVRHTSRRR